MIIAFDIGNTNVAAAIFSGGAGGRGIPAGEPLSHWKLRRPRRAGARWWKELVVLLCAEAGAVPADVDGCAISSVVPGATTALAAVLKRLTGASPLVVKGSLPLGIRFAYRDPAALGPDRVCGMLAAVTKYGAPVIVADCGTAITVDAVARGKRHTGGMIAPGIAMSALALSKSTAALPLADWALSSGPEGPAGRDTLAAIRAGTWYSAVGGVREGIAGLKKLAGKGATVVGTGGDAAVIQKETGMFDAVDAALVLEGAAIAWRIISLRRGGKR